jgi:predicted dehydrogenase
MAVLSPGRSLPCASAPIPIAVIGFGRMGQRHARALVRSPDFQLAAVVDADAAHAASVPAGVPFHTAVEAVFGKVRAAVIAVSTESHAPVFEQLAQHGIDCLIEKPIGTSVAQLDWMAGLAAKHGTRIFAGYCERFHPVVQALRGILAQYPRHIEVRRTSVAAPSRVFDTDVMMDLLVHDLDWLYSIIDQEPEDALLESCLRPRDHIEEVTCRLRFGGALHARLTASRIADTRRRVVAVTLANGELGEFSFDAPHDAASEDNLSAQAKALAAALRGEPSAIAGLQDARRVMLLVERLRGRLAEGHRLEAELADVG